MADTTYLRILVEDIHSTVVATIGEDGRPVTRVIDIMLYDEAGLYFLTARGKDFYRQLMEQGYVSLSSIKDKRSISLRGRVRSIGSDRLDEIFEKNSYMQRIYPEGTRDALEVFQLYDATGEFFDISDPSNVTRGGIVIGDAVVPATGFFVGNGCTGCGSCLEACPQRCIDTSQVPAAIDQGHCLHCGRCVPACPAGAIERR